MKASHRKSSGSALTRAVAIVAAIGTLSGGLLIPGTAVADDAAAATQQTTGAQAVAGGQAATTGTGAQQPAQSDAGNSGVSGTGTSNTGTAATNDGTKTADAGTISSLDNPDPVEGTVGGEDLKLPTTVTAHYSDGTAKDVAVTWGDNGYRSDADLKSMPAGNYTFHGTVEGSDKQVAMLLVLKEAEAPNTAQGNQSNGADQQNALRDDGDASANALAESGAGDSIKEVKPATYDALLGQVVSTNDLPTDVGVIMDDGSPYYWSVQWDDIPSEKFNQLGSFTVEGTLWNTSLKATLTVTVREIKSFEAVNVTTLTRVQTELPGTVNALMNDGTTLPQSVSWEPITTEQYAKPGKFTVQGIVKGSALKPVANVTVKDIKSFETIFISVAVGQDPAQKLPSYVNVFSDDGSVTRVYVQGWDSIDPGQYDHENTFEVGGRLGSDVQVKATVRVYPIREISNPWIYTVPGQMPALPSTVQTYVSNGDSISSNVTWDSIDPAKYATQGKFTVEGDVEYTDIKAVATVSVVPIVSVADVTESTVVGDPIDAYYGYPSVTVTYADGRTDYLNPQWDSVPDERFDTTGEFDVSGTVPGTDLKAVCHVTVYAVGPQTQEIVDTTVKGQAPYLSTYNHYFDTTSGDKVSLDVQWDSVDPSDYAQEGTFDVNGEAVGHPEVKIVAHITVISIKSVNPVNDVKTMTGVLPNLPSYVTVNYSNNTSESCTVQWQTPSSAQISKPGEFDVTGTLLQYGQTVSVHVKVLDSQKTRPISASTLRGIAPTMPGQVDTVLMDGTTMSVPIQWDTPNPGDYIGADASSFEVAGYLQGSNIPVICTVGVFDAAGEVSANATTTVGSIPRLPQSLNLKLTNGDTVNIGSGLLWDSMDSASYAQPGVFDVSGQILGTDVKPVAHVSVKALSEEPVRYDLIYVRGSGPLSLPQFIVDSTYVTWDRYDESKLETLQTFTVNGTYGNGQKAIAEITVVDYQSTAKQATAIIPVRKDTSRPVYIPVYLMDVVYSNGVRGSVPVTWDEVDGSQYLSPHTFTVNGTAGYAPKTWKVTCKVTVIDDVQSVQSVSRWTVPGVEPSLPDSVGVMYPNGIQTKLADEAKSPFSAGGAASTGGLAASSSASGLPSTRAAAGGSSCDSSYDTCMSVAWDPIDPQKYAASADNSTFKVSGTIEGIRTKVTATVKVASIRNIPLNDMTIAPDVPPSTVLPNQAVAQTIDGQWHSVYLSWDGVPASQYQEVGATFTVHGRAYIGSIYGDAVMPVSVTVRVLKPVSVNTDVQGNVVTGVGVPPVLAHLYPVVLDDGSVINVPVTWDEVPAKQYAAPGTFTVTGHLQGKYGTAKNALRRNSADLTNGTVQVTVTVQKTIDNKRAVYVDWQRTAIRSGDKDFADQLPQTANVAYPGNVWYSGQGGFQGYGGSAWLPVKWDLDGVDVNKPGLYEVKGTIDGVDRQALLYLTVSDTSGATVTGFEPVAKEVNVGSTPKQVVATLPDKVKASYADGSSHVVQVNWNATELTQSKLNTAGSTITVIGNVAGTAKQATATITVVKGSSVPIRVNPVGVETLEGQAPKLPAQVDVVWSDGATETTRKSDVAWSGFGDNLWADGKGGTSFTVAGVAKDGALDVTATVTVTKAAKYTVTFDPNGGKLTDDAKKTVRENSQLAAPSAPTMSGHTFVGWFTEAEGGQKVPFPYMVTGDVTLHAHWTLAPIPVQSVAIAGNGITDGKVTLARNTTLDLSAVVKPSNATDPSVTWTTSAPAVVSVKTAADGKATITALKGGKATITVTTQPLAGVTGDKAKTATLEVTVPASIVAITARIASGKDTCTKGDTFDASTLTVTAKRDDGQDRELEASEYTLGDTTLDAVGAKQVNVTLKSDATVFTSFTLTVKERYWKVTFDANGGSAVSEASVPDDHTTFAAKPTDPTRDGYAFVNWTTDQDGKKAYAFDSPVVEDLKLYAQWRDTAAPVLAGVSDAIVFKGSDFKYRDGVTATDNKDGDLTQAISVQGSVNTAVPGVYSLTYEVADAAGNKTSVIRKVTVAVKPVPLDSASITGEGIVGGKLTLPKGESLVLGAAVTPADATNITAKWTVSDTNVASVDPGVGRETTLKALRGGSTTVTLTVTQPNGGKSRAGNTVKTATFTLEVPRTAVSVDAQQTQTFAGHAPKSLPETVVVHYDDGSKASKDVTWNAFDWSTATAGQRVTLSGAVDGETLKATLDVSVVADSQAPVLTLPNGGKDLTIKVGSTFDALAGVSATDDVDGDLDVTTTVTVVGTVDVSTVGDYKLIYEVADSSGNKVTVSRIVKVRVAHTVTFDGNGGSSTAAIEVLDGQTAAKPADPKRGGFDFTGWSADKEGKLVYDFSKPVDSDLTLFAQWKAKPAGAPTDTPQGSTGTKGGASGTSRIPGTGASIAVIAFAGILAAAMGYAFLNIRRERKPSGGRHTR